jgi:site-specific DNA recombinase
LTSKIVRCAIYTRKSSEEGLEQAFNSLEAQREACCAYILSQKHEGWTALTRQYDDGGFSGGTMDRPALKHLLDDIQAGKVDTVVVYKVDRLTRALNDFSKIIEVFDSHSVSFVSVTQQFNTTTSMGRLTLNVLLSFAQFEREVTGERIRDKVAASKKKGMWMGGSIPRGYDWVERKLIVNRSEAGTVLEIFQQYLRLGSVMKLKDYLDREGIQTGARTSKTGRQSGGQNYSRGALYHLLSNRIYVGEIVHKGKCYKGEHEAIIPKDLWNRVADRLKANNRAHRGNKIRSTSSLLRGLLFDARGVRLTPTHAVKNGKRHRYYTSQASIQKKGEKPDITRFPAQGLEELVTSQFHLLLQSYDKCTVALEGSPEKDIAVDQARKLVKQWPELEISQRHEFIRNALRRAVVGDSKIWMAFDPIIMAEVLVGHKLNSANASGKQQHDLIKITAEFKPFRRGRELCLVGPKNSLTERVPNPSLVKAVAIARDWYEKIIAGEMGSISKLAAVTGVGSTYAKRILRYATLSPEIVDSILTANHNPDLSLQRLPRTIPLEWRRQLTLICPGLHITELNTTS